MKNDPKVTIVIPVYNGSNYMKDAIDSALAQTYKNLEIIVVNDGSKDDTDKIALSYGDKIKYLKKENGGVSTALNLALKNMTGEYFSWLSHDDYYYPEKIEKQIEFLNKQKDKNIIIYNNFRQMDASGKDFKNDFILNHEELNQKSQYALLHGHINGITLLIPKKAFDEFGKFDESLRCTQDYDMWLRMSKKYKFVHMEDILTKTRIHENQDTLTSPKMVSEGNRLWLEILESLTDEEKIKLEGSLYGYYYSMGKFLIETPYNEVIDYIEKKCIEIDPDKYKTQDLKKLKKSAITRGIYSLKNEGIKNAVGEYVLFLDSDDWISPQTLGVCYNEILINDPDIIVFRLQNHNSTLPYNVNISDGFYNIRDLEKCSRNDFIISEEGTYLFPKSLSGKCFRHEIILKSQIRIPQNILVGEDGAAFIDAILKSKNISVINNNEKASYYCLVRPNSISRSSDLTAFEKAMSLLIHYHCILKDANADYSDQFNRNIVAQLYTAALLVIRSGGTNNRLNNGLRGVLQNKLIFNGLHKAKFNLKGYKFILKKFIICHRLWNVARALDRRGT